MLMWPGTAQPRLSGKEVGAIAIPVALAEHDARLRVRLREALRADAEIAVVADTGIASAAARLALERPIRVLVLGASIRRDHVLAALETVSGQAPRTRCLVVLEESGEEEQSQVLMAGAAAILPCEAAPTRVAQAIHALNAGEAVVPPPLLMTLLRRFRRATRAARMRDTALGPLSSREWQIIGELAAGHTTGETAQHLDIALATVHSHLRNIYRKLGVNSRSDALAVAERLRRQGGARILWTRVRPGG